MSQVSNEEVGRRLFKARESAGLSVSQMTHLMEISSNDLFDLEQGRAGLPADRIDEFCDLLEVGRRWLIFGQTEQSCKTLNEIWDAVSPLSRRDQKKIIDLIEMMPVDRSASRPSRLRGENETAVRP